MNNYYYGVNKDENYDKAKISTSSNGTDIEVFVNGTNVKDIQTVKIALENLIDKLVMSGWPPV